MVEASAVLYPLLLDFELKMQAAVRKNISVPRNPLSPPHSFAAFHSTPMALAKWKAKWSCKDEESAQQPSKTYIRYAVRQKRADAKRALKDFLLYGKTSKLHCQDEDLGWHTDQTSSKNSGKSKPQSSSSGKGKLGGRKPWKKKQSCYDDDDYGPHETIFQAAFGGRRGFTWSFSSWENYQFDSSTPGFEWKDESRWQNNQRRVWSESDVDDEPTDVGSHSHRRTLGLPHTGPLNLDAVKCAFRASALKWHPDKHQGPSQAIAEEKFKVCVDAYNSLCNALKSA